MIKIDKKYLESWMKGRQYLVEVTVKDVLHDTVTNKVWLSRGMVCSEYWKTYLPKMYLADSVDDKTSERRIEIAIHGTLGTRFMGQTITKNGEPFLIVNSEDTITEPLFDFQAVNVATGFFTY